MAICEDKHVVNIGSVQEQNNNDLNSSKLRNVDQMIIDSFWKLIEIKREIRLKAAESILNSLQQPKKGDISSNVSYCLQRLIKGLASPRKAARQGYALLLTELLRSFSSITIEDVLDLIKKNLSLTGDKTDKRANSIGQVLAFASIIQSGKFKNELEKIDEIINSLQILQTEKSNLQLAIYKLFINIFNQIDSDCFKQHIWPHLKKDLKIGWENCTPDILWILIVCKQLFPEILSSKFLMKHWNMEDIFHKENFIPLARIIKDSTSVHPSIHPVCNIIVENVLKLKNFKEFWKIVEENLFTPGQHTKEFLGFELVKIILPKLKKKSLVESVLLGNFSNILIKSSTTSQSSLNISAFEMCEFLVKFVSECKKSDIQVVVLKMFLKEPGAILFDRFTKGKTFSNIIQNLKSEAVKSFVELLKSIFLRNKNENEDVIVNDQTRTFALYQISVLVGHHTMVSDVCWKKECVQFLFLHSFFKIKESCMEVPESLTVPMDMSNSLIETCRTSFIRSLESLLKSSSVSSKKSQIQEKYEMMFSLLHYANNILNLPNNFIPLIDFNKIKELWEMVIQISTKLQKQQTKDGKLQESCAFQILFIYLGFQLFIDPSEISDILQELKECCTQALKKRKHQTNKLKDSETDEPNWIDMIIDLILSLLSHPSHLTRRIVMTIFPLFCPFMTENSLQLILDAINPQKSSDENNPLIKNDEVLEIEDENEDVSFESATSDEGEMDIDEGDESKINDLRNNLQAVLGNDEDSEHNLSDSEMFKLDDAIAQAFATQKKPNKKLTNLEETELIHFRMRCLDLLCSFLKSEPPLNQVIFLILPLINAMEYGYHHKNQATFAKKIETLLALLIKYRKNINNVNQTELSEILKKLMEKAKKATDFQVHKCLNQLCIYIVRCSRKMTQKNSLTSETKISEEWYIEDYKELLKHYLESSSTHILPDMFTSMIESCPETAWSFADDISKSAFSPDIRLYKKTQILTMLLTVLNCSKNLQVLTKKIWKKFYKNLLPNVLKAFKDITTTKEIKPTYTVELIKVILITEEINLKFEMSIKKFEEFNELKDITSKQEQKLPKKTRAIWRKLAKLLSINES